MRTWVSKLKDKEKLNPKAAIKCKELVIQARPIIRNKQERRPALPKSE